MEKNRESDLKKIIIYRTRKESGGREFSLVTCVRYCDGVRASRTAGERVPDAGVERVITCVRRTN
jgi:hypothetical protein